jgi:Spy/CpxP family protein refolding chaperone
MSLNRTSRTLAMALALSAGLSVLPALAQPGPHGHRGGGDPLAHAIGELKSQLNLTASQQQAWDAAIAAGKQAREAAKQSRQTVSQLAHDELAKPSPDLAKIAAAADQAHDAAVAARRQVRNQFLSIYATFSTEQKALVQQKLAERMARMDSFRERMRERFGKN